MRLVSQAQEFVLEVKVRLLELLHDRSVSNLAEIFLTGWWSLTPRVTPRVGEVYTTLAAYESSTNRFRA